MLLYYSITLFLVAILVKCSLAFVNLYPQRCAHTKLSCQFYDDFGDTSFNDENSNSNIASLTSRINEVKSVEQAYDGKIARNWSKGVSIVIVHFLCAHLMLILYTMTINIIHPIPYETMYRIGELEDLLWISHLMILLLVVISPCMYQLLRHQHLHLQKIYLYHKIEHYHKIIW